MFCNVSFDANEYSGQINVGDLISLKPNMMLVHPNGPVLVLSADNDKGIYEIMYTSNSYVVGVSRIDIKGMFSENRRTG